MVLKVKQHDPNMPPLERHGDWIDLRFCGIHPASPTNPKEWDMGDNSYCFFPDDFYILSLGISVEIPSGYEAHILPRSSLFKRHGIFMANSMGVIDNSYCGDDDIWGFPAYFTRYTILRLYERIAQFRLVKVMPPIKIEYVQKLGNKNRGGFGQSGN